MTDFYNVKHVRKSVHITNGETAVYGRDINQYEAKSIIDPKKMNNSEIKPEEELDFEDYEEDCEYDDSEYEE